MEDALKKLDKLTHEEARMAVAQNLKATRNVDERVRGVANTVEVIDNRVACVGDQVATVDNRVVGVDDRVAGVDNRVAKVDDRVVVIDDRVASVNMVPQQTANDVDQIKRSSSLDLIRADCGTLRIRFREAITREHIQMALPIRPIKEP